MAVNLHGCRVKSWRLAWASGWLFAAGCRECAVGRVCRLLHGVHIAFDKNLVAGQWGHHQRGTAARIIAGARKRVIAVQRQHRHRPVRGGLLAHLDVRINQEIERDRKYLRHPISGVLGLRRAGVDGHAVAPL